MEHRTAKKLHNKSAEPMDRLTSVLNDFELVAQAASHDLKDPLRQAVIDFEALIKDYQNKPLDVPAVANIRVAIDAITLVINRISILRAYSRVVQNKQAFTDVSCEEVFNKAMEQLKPTIEANDANITHDPLPTVFGNAEQLTDLFKHLVDNAMRFCLDEPVIHVKAEDKGDMWEFSVQDNGIGLDMVYRDFIYAIFQCLDNESPNRGDGVGLTFSKKIVQNHGGSIRFESDGENGTCFYVTLPKR